MIQFIVTAVMASLLVGSTFAATSLRSRAIKQEICGDLQSRFPNRGLNTNECMKGIFEITDVKKIELSGTEQTTLLKVTTSFSEKSFDVVLKRTANIDDEGNVLLSNEWHVSDVSNESFGVTQLILESNVNSKNVKELNSNEMKNLPAEVFDWSYNSQLPDWDSEGFKYYKISHPQNLKLIIGYIVEESASSSEADSKTLVTQHFDAKGNRIGDEDVESWGFDE